jgi:hypothetical protein
MYITLGVVMTLIAMFTTNRFKRTETYTREQLESDLTALVSDLEKDGILQQDDTEDE